MKARDALLPSMIKNKDKRSQVHAKQKQQKRLEKKKRAKATEAAEKRALELGEEPPPRKIPRTIENTRELDETVCRPDDDELFAANDADEFSNVIKQERIPKVMITTCRFHSTVSFSYLLYSLLVCLLCSVLMLIFTNIIDLWIFFFCCCCCDEFAEGACFYF